MSGRRYRRQPRSGLAADPDRPPDGWPRRCRPCCGGPASARTSRSGPTARRALFTPTGELVVQAENIPVHLGSMPASVAVAIEPFRRARSRPGEQIILNDPFDGGTHLNDVTLVAGASSAGGWSAGSPTGPTTRTSAAPRRARYRPTPPRSSRRVCASRRYASPPRCGRSCWPTPARPTSGAATSTPRSAPTGSARPVWPSCRIPGRRWRRRWVHGLRPSGSCPRLRRASHAGRPRRRARRDLALRRRRRLHRRLRLTSGHRPGCRSP